MKNWINLIGGSEPNLSFYIKLRGWLPRKENGPDLETDRALNIISSSDDYLLAFAGRFALPVLVFAAGRLAEFVFDVEFEVVFEVLFAELFEVVFDVLFAVEFDVVLATLLTLVFARVAFALAVLVFAASPQAMPKALTARTVESTITFFI